MKSRTMMEQRDELEDCCYRVGGLNLAGKHPSDYIEITPAMKRTILNKWKNPDGSPKDISIP